MIAWQVIKGLAYLVFGLALTAALVLVAVAALAYAATLAVFGLLDRLTRRNP